MPRVYDRKDFYWSRRGDIVLDQEGDLLDTEYDLLRSLIQEIRTRIQSEQGEWDLYLDLGSNMSDLIGEANNRSTAENGKAKIIAGLSQYGLVDTNDLSVQYIPIDESTILYRIKIKISPTPGNYNMESIKLDILYNYQDNNLHLI
jgi:hypothetical protein